MNPIPESLLAELLVGRLVPFVGSGVSRAACNFPAWDGLLERMAQRLEKEAKSDEAGAVRYFIKKQRFLEAAGEALKQLGKAAFHQVLRDTFDVPQPQDPTALALPQALWSLRPTIVVTTNYDDVLGWANPAARTILNDQPAELAELYRTASGSNRSRVWRTRRGPPARRAAKLRDRRVRCRSSRRRTPSGSKRSAAISTCWACASNRARPSR
jgi:hypothetical protein